MGTENVACGECGTMITFSLREKGTVKSGEKIKEVGTGSSPYRSKEKTCPQCDSTVWIKVENDHSGTLL